LHFEGKVAETQLEFLKVAARLNIYFKFPEVGDHLFSESKKIIRAVAEVMI
jgi:hypothetical protein